MIGSLLNGMFSSPRDRVTPLPPVSGGAASPSLSVDVLNNMRDRMTQTGTRMSQGGNFVINNLRNPFTKYPQLYNRGLPQMTNEQMSQRDYGSPTTRPRYL